MSFEERPDHSPQNAPAAPWGKFARQFAAAVELPFILVADVFIGGGIGYWIDGRFHTSPLFLLALGGLGFAAGLMQILRTFAGRASRRDS